MQPFVGYLAALAVAAVFYIWRAYTQVQTQRQRLIRERVAYMLWVMAEQIDPRTSASIRRLSSG
jgi:hypothetical protein